MNLFAQAIHAAVGEDGSAEERIDFARIGIRPEIPRGDALVPRIAGIGEIAVLLRDDDEIECRVVPFPCESRRRSADRGAVGACRALPRDGAITTDERNVRALNGFAGIEASDERERVLRTVFDVHAQIGDLDDGRLVCFTREPARIRDRAALAYACPDNAFSRWAHHARQIDAGRLNRVCFGAKRALKTVAGRHLVEPPIDICDRLHQIGASDRLRPLRHADQVTGVKRQHQARGRFPDAMTIAKARECPLVPVRNDVGPVVAERLSISR